MGCGRSSLKSNTSDQAEIIVADARAVEEARQRTAIGQAREAAEARVAAEARAAKEVAEEKAKQAESSSENALYHIQKHLESLPRIPDSLSFSDTLIFGDSITPSEAFPFTIYINQPVEDVSTRTYTNTTLSRIITIYSMPNELLFRNNIVLFTYNVSSTNSSSLATAANFDLYESDINPTNLDIYQLVRENKARRVGLLSIGKHILVPVKAFYNITLNSGKYYQVIISSRWSPAYPTDREIIYYKSSVKQYMGIDGFKNKNFYNIEGYMETHPLLPKNYYPFKL